MARCRHQPSSACTSDAERLRRSAFGTLALELLRKAKRAGASGATAAACRDGGRGLSLLGRRRERAEKVLLAQLAYVHAESAAEAIGDGREFVRGARGSQVGTRVEERDDILSQGVHRIGDSDVVDLRE
eukprot:CAMPEP_0115872600 /NCGR_PEP_ID=MMETSP0287-20121206/23518_1 /TAXON_ID=412157 /ORGANISM="Chrysochromulina rotalis, Strain UIO044" /LENGTH=128 /DNA_ID=CAMNT_0003327543 /DNA_START=400 /DNA_END=787 /DNA_ORIENTATION=+